MSYADDKAMEVIIVFQVMKSGVVGWTTKARRPRFVFAWLAMGIFAAACDSSALEGGARAVHVAVVTAQPASVEDTLSNRLLDANGQHTVAHVRHPAVVVSGELPPVTVTLFERPRPAYGPLPGDGADACASSPWSGDRDAWAPGAGPGQTCAASPDAAFATAGS